MITKLQAEQAVIDALRKFEEAHAKWMDTSRFSAEADAVTKAKDDAAREYSAACRIFDDVRRKAEEAQHTYQSPFQLAILKLVDQRDELAEVARAVKDWGNGIDPRIRQMAIEALAKLEDA